MFVRSTGLAARGRRLTAPPVLALGLLVLVARPCGAWVDIFDRGPALIAGKYNLRVSNAGILGNPFPDISSDPSFEYPKGSGQELLHDAALWVGALDPQGTPRVSGGPLLEFRPTLAPDDTVREAWHGQIGSLRGVDDDGDGAIDEEILNGKDDDGDGEIDEDLGLIGQQMLSADYTDDQPEAVHVYAGGEVHEPLGLSVHQEAYAFATPGYDGIAGLQFTITNHGTATLREVYVGLYCDLDVDEHAKLAAYSNDALTRVGFTRSVFKGGSRIYVEGQGLVPPSGPLPCFTRLSRTVPVVIEPQGSANPNLPVVAVLPLDHTKDPLSFFVPDQAKAPARDAFRISVFATDLAGVDGSPPLFDADRYAALKGEWPQSPDDHIGDQVVLISAGPFHRLAPGQSIDFAAALVAAPSLDSLKVALGNAAFVENGVELNRLPDDHGNRANWWITGATGVNGHEVCLEVPPGVAFQADPNCPLKFASALGDPPGGTPHNYTSDEPCVWTDADCDVCTGLNGNETVLRWLDPGALPPSPSYRAVAGNHAVRIEWDNLPEILVQAGKAGPKGGTFIGYRVHRLSDWRGRGSLLPTLDNWESIATFGYDTRDSKQLLPGITDSTLDYQRIWYEQKAYPVGRYAMVDTLARNGFDYIYVVTTLVEVQTLVFGNPHVVRYETPLVAEFGQRVVPGAAARSDAKGVWVVPNPFRGGADWDRPPVYGDRFTRHLDFMGLPRARATIRIWTLAGDHVATIEHDGTTGNGEAAWDLISRKGQDVASGIYLFTVESPLGNSRGRFVVIR